MPSVDNRPISVYLRKDVRDALADYRDAGHQINLSHMVQLLLCDRFISIEKGRRITGDPFLYTPVQLANMKLLVEKGDRAKRKVKGG